MNEDLFGYGDDHSCNLLPYDGDVFYHGVIFDHKESVIFFQDLLHSIHWQHDQVKLYGKIITTKRKVAWYGDEPFSYTYSNATKYAQPWTDSLLAIKHNIENKTQESFNSCLLNLYHSGAEGMAWHSDAEKELKKGAPIASVSLGAKRKFCFKHKKKGEVINQMLEDGSLLVMRGNTQQNWLHRLPPTKKVLDPRINLTFRTICSG